MSDKQQVMIRLTTEQLRKIEDMRASQRPIPSVAELIRRALDEYLAKAK